MPNQYDQNTSKLMVYLETDMRDRLFNIVSFLNATKRTPGASYSGSSLVEVQIRKAVEEHELQMAEYLSCDVSELHSHPRYLEWDEATKKRTSKVGRKKKTAETE